METFNNFSIFSGAAPWEGMSSNKGYVVSDGANASLHYRGWTLVDVGRSRYAVENATGRRMRVCNVDESQKAAIGMFRSVVDEEMGS